MACLQRLINVDVKLVPFPLLSILWYRDWYLALTSCNSKKILFRKITFKNTSKERQNVYFLDEFTFHINGAERIKAPFIKQPCTTLLRYSIHFKNY